MGCRPNTALTKHMTPILALAMESRGRAAWGVTDGDFTHRATSAISESFQELNLGAKHGVIYHTRAPSCGSNIIPNTHPFEFTGPEGRIIGIHNGHIMNHEALDAKHGRSFAVDSMHIFAHLAEGKDLAEIGGYGAIAWYQIPVEDPESRSLYLSSWNNGSLAIARLKTGEAVFASTESAIKLAARMCGAEIDTFYQVPPKERFSIEADGAVLRHGAQPWGEHPVTTPTHGTSWMRGTSHGVSDTSEALCGITRCNSRVDRTKVLWCPKCIQHYAGYYGIEYK